MSASSYSSFSTIHGVNSSGWCRAEVKRQKTYINMEKQYIYENEMADPLPIVELKPFVKEVWRREKSLPSFHDMLPPSKVLTRRKKDHVDSSGQHDKLDLYVGNGPTKERIKHGSGSISPRSKSKNLVHPQAETKAPKQIEHSICSFPGFISRDERSKTTLNEIQHSESPTKLRTGLMTSLEHKEVDNLDYQVNFRDNSFKPSVRVRRPLSYLIPFRNSMKRSGMWQQLQSTESLNDYNARNLMTNSPQSEDSAGSSSTLYYDSFDKNGTLPSIKISYQTLAKRSNKQRVAFEDLEYGDAYSEFHQISKINNALHQLSKYGAASKIERQLSFEFQINIKKFKKSRDYFPYDITQNEMAKYFPPPAINLTNGEKHIRQAQQNNTPKKKRKAKEKYQVHESPSEKFEDQDWGPSRTEDDRIIDTRNTNLDSALENIAETESEDDMKVKMNEITLPSQYDNATTTQASEREPDDLQTDVEPTQHSTSKNTIDIGLQSTFQSNMAEPPSSTQDMELDRTAQSTRTSDIISGVRDANVTFLDENDIRKDSENKEKQKNVDTLERDSTFLTSDLNADYGNPPLSVES